MVHRLPHGEKDRQVSHPYTLLFDVSHAIHASPASRPRISRNCRLPTTASRTAEKR